MGYLAFDGLLLLVDGCEDTKVENHGPLVELLVSRRRAARVRGPPMKLRIQQWWRNMMEH